MQFDDKLPVLDLRQTDEYQSGHIQGATHQPWPGLKERLNELPARPAKLQLVADEKVLHEASNFLAEKGYEVSWQLASRNLKLFFEKHPKICQAGSGSRALWQPCPLLKDFVETLAAGRRGDALDIGCGGGRDSVYLAMQGWQVVAVDKQEPVLQRARQLASYHNQNVQFIACDLGEQGCLPEQMFDLIVVIRYLNRSLYDWIKRHLNSGGVVIMQTFTEGVEVFASPKNPNFILQKNELAKTFSDFEIIIDRIEQLKDGRPVASFIAKKKEE